MITIIIIIIIIAVRASLHQRDESLFCTTHCTIIAISFVARAETNGAFSLNSGLFRARYLAVSRCKIGKEKRTEISD